MDEYKTDTKEHVLCDFIFLASKQVKLNYGDRYQKSVSPEVKVSLTRQEYKELSEVTKIVYILIEAVATWVCMLKLTKLTIKSCALNCK